MNDNSEQRGFAWQVGVWNLAANFYETEIVPRFVPITKKVIALADLKAEETALDLGTGTGMIAFTAAEQVGPKGRVTAVDISREMLVRARAGAEARSLTNIEFKQGRAEAVPVSNGSQDAVMASLSLMYVIDRYAAAKEIARILRPGGKFIAAVWSGPEKSDIVQFQQIARSFAPTPPVEGVGPGSMADLSQFLLQLTDSGIDARAEIETIEFDFVDLESAWRALAYVTAAGLNEETQEEAKSTILERMWEGEDGPRVFRNDTQFIVGKKRN